jgi:hypothetical protein
MPQAVDAGPLLTLAFRELAVGLKTSSIRANFCDRLAFDRSKLAKVQRRFDWSASRTGSHSQVRNRTFNQLPWEATSGGRADHLDPASHRL